MQGIVNVLGYEAKAMLHIDTVWGFPVRVMMDFELDPVNLGPVVQIRRDKGSALGPKVLIHRCRTRLVCPAY